MADRESNDGDLDNALKSARFQRALSPQSADFLRTRARPQTAEAKYGVIESAPAPSKQSEPVSAYMIDPKYLPKERVQPRREPALQGATSETKNFHNSLAVPMVADRIRRPRTATVIPVQDHDARDFWEQDRPMERHESVGQRIRTDAGAALAAVATLLIAGATWVRNFASDSWKQLRDRGPLVNYSVGRGARRHGLAAFGTRMAIVIPLLAILGALTYGALTGSINPSRIAPSDQGNNSGTTTQNEDTDTDPDATETGSDGSPGPGDANDSAGQQGAGGTATNGTTGVQPADGRGAGGTVPTTGGAANTTGTTGNSGTTGTTGLPVGGRGGGEDPAAGTIPATTAPAGVSK